jgi:hypothetical protein
MSLQNPKLISNLDGRAAVAAGYIELTLANFVARNNVIDIDLPPGSELVSGHLNVTDAFDAATTDTIKVGDNANDARYLAASTVKATGRTVLVPTGFINTGDTHTLRVTRVASGTAATKGTVRIYFQYAEIGKSDWTQGDQGAGYYPT